MERHTRNSRVSHPQLPVTKQRRSGYEPSDTETEWQESPPNDLGLRDHNLGSIQSRNKSPFKLSWRTSARFKDEPSSQNREEGIQKPDLGLDRARSKSKSPLKLSRRHSRKFEDEPLILTKAPEPSPTKRRPHSKSPYKPPRNDVNLHNHIHRNVSPSRNVSPFAKNEDQRHVSPYKSIRGKPEKSTDVSKVSEKSNYSHRSQSAPRPRFGFTEQYRQRTPSPLPSNLKEREAFHRNTPSVGELNEIIANVKLSIAPGNGAPNDQSTDSISQGDIFFSREYTSMMMTKQNIVLPSNGDVNSRTGSNRKLSNGRLYAPNQRYKENGNMVYSNQRNSSTTVTTRTTAASSTSFSRQSSDKASTIASSKMSNTSISTGRFVENRRNIQTEPWFSCLKKGYCRTSKSEGKAKEFDETAFIEKAFVVETLRQFWADKHQPASLDGFTCHKQEAQLLKQLVSHGICPNILLKGPTGFGKRALTRALLGEIFGDSSWNISHKLRHFHIQETKTMQVVVPVTSSAHHIELNVYTEPNAKFALISLVKELSNNYAMTPEISLANARMDFKVMILYDVDKATANVQHLIKWIMDCYAESCKLILCCEDDEDIIEPVKNRCKVVKVDAPVTHEIMEVLIQIARKEEFDLPMNFAAKIANKSRQNPRQAIMALEACKAHNYPFVDDQPIPLGWEEVVDELAAEVLADPSHDRIFAVRGKFQKLLVEFVHPKLILQGLVERFLKAVEGRSKRELYYWHAYYEKRLPIGTSALLKLEEFVAKFMSIHRRRTMINRAIPKG